MANQAEKILKSMPPDQQAQAKQFVAGVDFGELFKDLDLGVIGKRIAKTLIDYAQEHILPKVQQMNSTLAFILAGILDALENQVK